MNLPIADTKVLSTRRWVCAVCDFVYDERKGWPEEGILPGTQFEAIPDSWVCPDCGVTKADFYCED